MPRISFFLRQALSALRRSLGVTILAVVTIGLSLTVLATFVVTLSTLSTLADRLGRSVEISAYLKRDASAEKARALTEEARGWQQIREAHFLTSKQAMEDFRKSLGDDQILLEGLPADVLPPSIEIVLIPKSWTSEEVEKIGKRIAASPIVQDVRYGQEDIEKVNALLGFARLVSLVLGAALFLATVFIVSNTIRLTVYARRDEIEILALVGATGAFVRAPFLLEGAIQGLLGGTMASLTLVGFEGALRVGIERGLSYAYGPVALDFVPLEYLGYLLAAGFVLGLLGSLLAVGKFLRL